MRFSAVLIAAVATLSVASNTEESTPEMAARDFDELEERDELAGDAANLDVRFTPFLKSTNRGINPPKPLRATGSTKSRVKRDVDDLDTRSTKKGPLGYNGGGKPWPSGGGRGQRPKRDLEARLFGPPIIGTFKAPSFSSSGKGKREIRDVDDLETRAVIKAPTFVWAKKGNTGFKKRRDVDDLETRAVIKAPAFVWAKKGSTGFKKRRDVGDLETRAVIKAPAFVWAKKGNTGFKRRRDVGDLEARAKVRFSKLPQVNWKGRVPRDVDDLETRMAIKAHPGFSRASMGRRIKSVRSDV